MATIQIDFEMGIGLKSLPNPGVEIHPTNISIVDSQKLSLVGNLLETTMSQSPIGPAQNQAYVSGPLEEYPTQINVNLDTKVIILEQMKEGGDGKRHA